MNGNKSSEFVSFSSAGHAMGGSSGSNVRPNGLASPPPRRTPTFPLGPTSVRAHTLTANLSHNNRMSTKGLSKIIEHARIKRDPPVYGDIQEYSTTANFLGNRSKSPHRNQWNAYNSTSPQNWQAGKPAFLHSQREPYNLHLGLHDHNVDIAKLTSEAQGHVYQPTEYGGHGRHSMDTNTAWMLGLAHNNRPIVMTSDLTKLNMTRKSAPEGATPSTHLSALGREVWGLVKGNRYEFNGADQAGRTHLRPTSHARHATLSDMQTPPHGTVEFINTMMAAGAPMVPHNKSKISSVKALENAKKRYEELTQSAASSHSIVMHEHNHQHHL